METFKQCVDRIEADYPGVKIRHMWKWFAKVWWSAGVTFGPLGLVDPGKFETRQCSIAVHEGEHAYCWTQGGIKWLWSYCFSRKFRWQEECYAYARQALYEHQTTSQWLTIQGLSWIKAGFVNKRWYLLRRYKTQKETEEQILKFAMLMGVEREGE